jgi:hypothetical protein
MQRVPWTQPLGRSGTAAAYDPVRQRLVLFGGIDGNQLSNETWEWDGSQWSLRPTALAPPARAGHAMAWDGTRGRIVVHGGSGYLNDQWEWDGTGWSLVSVSGVIPPGRNAHSLAYDSRRRRLVLFGGYTGTGYPPHDTWEWDGTSWTRQTPAASPSGPTGPMAYDEGRGVTALWVDLWSVLYEWDGANWTRPTPPTQPPYQRLTSYSNLAYDPLRRRIGLYRSTLARMFEHWEWDGMLWVERHDPGLPYAHPPLLIHDAGRSRSVLLAMTHPEAWELQIPWDTVGPGHPLGGGPIVTPSDVARPGDRQCFTVTLPSPQRAGFHLLLVAAGTGLHPAVVLTPPGACSPGLLHLAPHAILAAQGEPGFFCWSLPPSPGLVGQTFVVQALSMVVGGCFYLSDALGFVIQPGPFPSRP